MGVTYNYGAGPTYTKIGSQTLGSSASSVTFSNLPQNYTDLLVVMNYGMTTGSGLNTAGWRFNGDTGSSTLYSQTLVQGDGSSATSNRTTSASLGLGLAYTSNNSVINAHVTLQIMNYSNTTTFKSAMVRGNAAGNATNASILLYRSTSAITSIEIVKEYSPIFCAGSTFTLYGIAAALKPKATGGTVTFDPGTSKWVHTFTSSGAFTPTQGLTAEYLVVAGGGGGGVQYGGGGGAGGLILGNVTLTPTTSYTVTIGAGGAGANNPANAKGGNGSNTIIDVITANGGGGGGGFEGSTNPGANGGSGGGGSMGNTAGSSAAGGSATQTSPSGGTGYGNNGGSGWYAVADAQYKGGGGGGAGAAGDNAPQNSVATGANGGNGIETSLSGTATYYAGGGGGHNYNGTSRTTGGSGGGGFGSRNNQDGTAGTVNTGGGGGGGGNNSVGGNGKAGGSGIVIVRYSA